VYLVLGDELAKDNQQAVIRFSRKLADLGLHVVVKSGPSHRPSPSVFPQTAMSKPLAVGQGDLCMGGKRPGIEVSHQGPRGKDLPRR